MKLRTAVAALASTACTALTAGALIAGPASAATAARQAIHPRETVPTDTFMSMKVGGSSTTKSVAFDQQGTVELDFNVGNDGSVGVTGTVTVFDGENGQAVATVCNPVQLQGFGEGSCTVPDSKLPVGTHHLFAFYNGDSNNSTSESPAITLTVTKEPTTAAMTTVSQVAFGQESDEVFTVTAHPRTSGTPTGPFEVLSGTTTFCDAQLVDAVGRCSLTDTQLAPGTYQFTGFYDSDSTYAGSVSDTQTVTVTPGTTTTSLSLSPSRIGFGQQQTEQMTVHVAPRGSGTPTGQVSIKAGASTICAASLTNGTATCALGIGQLPVGSYQLTAFYAGDSNFQGSTSGPKVLTVTQKSVATASLTLSAPRVTFGREGSERLTVKVRSGHEQAEHLSVQVKPQSGGTPTGKVTIKAGTVKVCVITLKNGKGTCSLKASQLRPGTYHLAASYAAAAPYAGSASARKTLTVTK